MNNNHYCVIMAGGMGGRLWPLCRETMPKQFMDISGVSKSFLRNAYDRCEGLFKPENIIVVTLKKYRELVKEQIPELPDDNLLLEPYAGRTGPCIAYATYHILKKNPKAIVTVTPSDHIILGTEKYHETLLKAMEYATLNPVLITIGIRPKKPDTNYGYIQIKGGKNAYSDDKPIKVKTFTEKPNAELAEVFYKSGEFFWNSGIFVWQAQVILEEMEKYMPDVTAYFEGWEQVMGSPQEQTLIETAYCDCRKISIDYGVMEKTERAWIFPAHFDWLDIDSWETLYSVFPQSDENANVYNIRHRYFKDSKGNMIVSRNTNKLVAVKNLKDYIVVDTDDVLMICPRNDTDYRDLLAGLTRPDYEKFR